MGRATASTKPLSVRDGAYRSTLNVDGVSTFGVLEMVDNNGRGADGRFQFEVHVSGKPGAVGGIVNVMLDSRLASQHRIPEHFSMPVTGSGNAETFNLIGFGPNGILVELDAGWNGT